MVRSVLNNYILICSLVSWLATQLLKILTGTYHNRNLSVVEVVLANGGMPSSHAGAVAALCTASLLKYGVDSFQFAFTAVFALVVIRDASGVRNQVGKQAKFINQMFEDERADLKELIGHTPLQVAVGAAVGVLIAVAFWQVY